MILFLYLFGENYNLITYLIYKSNYLILICCFLINYIKIYKIKKFDKPLVSIIIPVYNKFKYTFKCIISILNNTDNISYEIIIADDMSTDLTKFIKYFFKNIIISKNKGYRGFVMNCNKAALLANGKYIHFLNNDIIVQKGWLTNLVKLIESNEKIGMVGSKLINPDNTLQEAGGIIWSNGKGENYGRGNNPKLPEYNYVKEVDYISGCSILVKKSLWKEIGGFDERYIPAYYEDTDFAFEVRKHGYKVMYQPKSEVIHLEGISNGKSLKSGLKQYQLENRWKFIKKWDNILKKQFTHLNLFNARDRNFSKKRIIVFDKNVPYFDKNAGNRCTFMYLQIFQQFGFFITFVSDKFEKNNKYITILEQKGIEVIYKSSYMKNFDVWLKNNLKYFNYVFLQRPNVAVKYINIIKKYFHGKLLYFAHDLNYNRLFREYKITGKEKFLKQSKFWEKKEMEIIYQSDVCYVVGNYEEELLKKIFKYKPIRNIPIYIYENLLSDVEKDFSKRKDLIFVANFNHRPNIDAILWFSKEIYPYIIKKYPNIILHIVGSPIIGAIKKIESDNIKLYGFLDDKDLLLLYKKCRIAIAPLRFGAGVKGKIIEAAYNQIPMITTSIGAEGLDKSIGSFLVEDDALKMSKLICSLYNNYNKLKEISDSGINFIKKYFTPEIAKEILLKDIKL